MKYYEVNNETLAVIPIGYEKTKIIEVSNEYFVDKAAYEIMDESCQYYGSSYKGRLVAAKKILNCSYKIPILVEETQNVIFFPTKSSLEKDCCWINFKFVKNIEKYDNGSMITFNNNSKFFCQSSKLSLENQLSRSIKLGYAIQQRSKMNIND